MKSNGSKGQRSKRGLLPLVSVVVTTRNEEHNVGTCLESIKLQSWPTIETIVVDNNSADRTWQIASKFTSKVYSRGPERSAQRNYGLARVAQGVYVLFLDADMILAPKLVEAAVRRMEDLSVVALHIPEIILGSKYLSKVRRFERSFYDGTVIDAARFFRRKAIISVGGFDRTMSGPEDWDVDKKIKLVGSISLLTAPEDRPTREWQLLPFVESHGVDPLSHGAVIYHNESEFDLRNYVRKKMYYAQSFDRYIEKWGKNDSDVALQFGLSYRYFGVFCERGKWKRLVTHPLLCIGVYLLRGAVGGVFLLRRMTFLRRP